MPLKVVKADDYVAFHSTGASGGFLGNYQFRIDFHQDEVPPVERLLVDGKLPEVAEGAVLRFVKASVALSMPVLKELSAWLAKQVEEHESQYGEIKGVIPLRLPVKPEAAPPEEKKDGL